MAVDSEALAHPPEAVGYAVGVARPTVVGGVGEEDPAVRVHQSDPDDPLPVSLEPAPEILGAGRGIGNR